MSEIPENIKPAWFSIASRLQSAARGKMLGGFAIISMKILVDEDGNPRLWVEPEIIKIEPKRLANQESLKEISDEFMANIIKGLGS